MEKKPKTESKSITDKDNPSSKLSSSAGKLLKKKPRSEAKIYGKAGGKGG